MGSQIPKSYLDTKGNSSTPGGWAPNVTFSGCDIIPICYGRATDNNGNQVSKLFVIGDIATLSYSIHREFGGVRTLGVANVRSYVRGTRSIAGTMIFNQFNRRALYELTRIQGDSKRWDILDRIPAFDIVLYFSNEYGQNGVLTIFGVEISDEGTTYSVNDVYTEQTFTYVARDINVFHKSDDQYEADANISKAGTFFGQKFTDIESETKRLRNEIIAGNSPFNIPFDYTYQKA